VSVICECVYIFIGHVGGKYFSKDERVSKYKRNSAWVQHNRAESEVNSFSILCVRELGIRELGIRAPNGFVT